MFYGDLTEMHIEDKASPGFRKFLEKYRDRKDEKGLFIQFTYPRDPMDKRFAGQAMDKRDPYSSDVNDLTALKYATGVEVGKLLKDKEHIKKLKLADPTMYVEPIHKDPVGLYAYPIDYVVDHPLDIAYGSDMKALRVVKLNKKAKVLKLQNATEKDVRYVLETLTNYSAMEAGRKKDGNEPFKIKEIVRDVMMRKLPDRKGNLNGHAIWYFIQFDGYFRTSGKGMPVWEDTGRRSSKGQWEKALKLKWDAFEDTAWKDKRKIGGNDEAPVIYHGEPEQIVIFRRDAYSIEEMFPLQRKVRDPVLGTKDEIGGITYSDNEYYQHRRRIAEIAVKEFGDKVVYRAPNQQQGVRNDKTVSSLREVFEKLNHSSAIEIVKSGGTSIIDTITSPTFYMTKKGMVSVHIGGSSGGGVKSHHRAKTDTSAEKITIEYLNQEGYGSDSDDDTTVRQMIEIMKYDFPQAPWAVEKPEFDYESVKNAIAAVVKINNLFDNLYNNRIQREDFFELVVHTAKKVDEFMKIVGIEPLGYENLEDCISLFQIIKTISSAIPPNLVHMVENRKMRIVDGKNTLNYMLAEYNKEATRERETSSSGNIDAILKHQGLSETDAWLVFPHIFNQYVERHPELERAVHAIKWMTVLNYKIKFFADREEVASHISRASDEAQALKESGDLPFTDPEKFGSDPTVHKRVWSKEDTEAYYENLKVFVNLAEMAKTPPEAPSWLSPRVQSSWQPLSIIRSSNPIGTSSPRLVMRLPTFFRPSGRA